MSAARPVQPDSSHRVRENGQTGGARHDLIRSLDDLALLSSDELRGVFASGTVPASLASLDGDLRGRMLALRRVEHGRVFRALAAIAKSPAFPWLGKSFRASDATHGEGRNRVRLVRPRHVAAFTTRFGTSTLDGKPCIVLDYRLPVHDELREVGPGVLLGPGCLERPARRPLVVLWFGLAT